MIIDRRTRTTSTTYGQDWVPFDLDTGERCGSVKSFDTLTGISIERKTPESKEFIEKKRRFVFIHSSLGVISINLVTASMLARLREMVGTERCFDIDGTEFIGDR